MIAAPTRFIRAPGDHQLLDAEPSEVDAEAAPVRMSALGILTAIAAAILCASVFRATRLKIGGMMVHPAQIVAMVPLVIAGPRGLRQVPLSLRCALVAFMAIFTLSCLVVPGGIPDVAKVGSSILMILAGAVSVKNDKDMRAIAVCLALAAFVMSIRVFYDPVTRFDELAGYNPMEGVANKNAFSLYVLPGLMLGSYYAFGSKMKPFYRTIVIAMLVVVLIVLFSTANRSGWLGAVLIGLMLAWRFIRNLKRLALIVCFAGSTTYLINHFGNRSVLERRIQETEEGYSSDQLRMELFVASLKVGLANPIIGVSPQRIGFDIQRRSGVMAELTDTHNVYATIGGGSGMIALTLLFTIGWLLWRRPRGSWAWADGRQEEAHYLLRCMVVLWAVRGFFSAEIIYSPAFSLAMGACIGFCISRGVWQRTDEDAEVQGIGQLHAHSN
jgi:hypothetical protein